MYCNAPNVSSFLACALLTPKMNDMFSRGGGLGGILGDREDGRMKCRGPAPAFSTASSSIPRLFCPQCQDLIIAATKSQHVSTNEVRHWWACETCGHEFRTTVQWRSPSLQGVSTEETVRQPV
jgi:hypothetical protein